MGRTSAAVKNRYANKAYDRLNIVIPKGQKANVEEYARMQGTTVNGLVNALLQNAMQLSEEDWKHPAPQEMGGTSSSMAE